MALKFRRGTTAQQSGSLAFGEPFVNTTLGTLIVGGDTGDIILASSTGLGLVSGSSQVTLQSTTGFTAYNTALATITGSLITSASADRVSITNLNTLTSSALTRFTNLESTTASLNISVSNLNTFSGSQLTKNSTLATYTASVDGRFTTIGSVTASYDGRFTSLATITGSLISSASADRVSITNLNTLTASALTRFTNLESTTASLNTSVSNLNTFSASENSKSSTLATYTGSNDTKWSTLGSLSGSFARTNSANIFNGNQTITGSLYVTQDLVVQGSSSIQNVSSSTLNIGTNLITVAVNQPSVRFGGIAVIDSGSSGASGSLLYDSVQDEFIFVHKGNGLNVTSSHFVLGPETIDNLGNENYLTNNRVPKGTGKEHLNDSQISDDGTTVTIPGALTVTGNITGPIRATNGVVSGSSQIVGSSITTNTITIGSTSTALGGTSTTLAGLTSVSSTGFTGALTGNASTATTLQTARTINGTSFNGSADITIPNLVSGSSQITAGSTTNFATDVKTQLNSNTVVSGSSQITISATTGYNANNYVDHTAVSISAGNGLSGGGTIAATRTLSLDTTSATFTSGVTTQNNALSVVSGSKTISGITLGSNLATLTIGTGLSGTSYNGSSAVTIANTGVTSNVAGTGVSVSGATGAVTISIGQSVATNATPTFGNLTINGTITATGDITAYYTSDRRHKNNIQTISNAVLKVKQLNGVTWEWNDDVNEVTKSTPKTGLIAQEVQAVLPQVVTERADGFLALDYSKMVGLLVEAIKEQQIQIDQLKAQLGSK